MVAWPEAGLALVTELRAHPGRIALAPVGPGLDDGLDAIAILLGTTVTRVGLSLTSGEQPKDAEDVQSRLAGASVLTDLDILLWRPWLEIDVLRLLSVLARRQPVIAAWPGEIRQDRATYSLPGRRDFCETRLSDIVVLRPRPRRFPDQTPFDVKHIPA